MTDAALLAKIKKEMLLWLNDAREFVASLIIRRCPDIEELMRLPIEELPLKINEYEEGSPKHSIVKLRLEGKDPFEEDLRVIMTVLYDVEFDNEEYKNLGSNDGTLHLLSRILELLGDEEHSQQASDLMYTAD